MWNWNDSSKFCWDTSCWALSHRFRDNIPGRNIFTFSLWQYYFIIFNETFQGKLFLWYFWACAVSLDIVLCHYYCHVLLLWVLAPCFSRVRTVYCDNILRPVLTETGCGVVSVGSTGWRGTQWLAEAHNLNYNSVWSLFMCICKEIQIRCRWFAWSLTASSHVSEY